MVLRNRSVLSVRPVPALARSPHFSGMFRNLRGRPSRTWTSCAAVFPVRTYHKEGIVQESKQGQEAACGWNTPGLSGKSARNTRSSKTSGGCCPAELRSSCKTWPRSGTMRNGKCFLPPPLVPLTIGKGFSLLPTPTVVTETGGIGFLLRSQHTWENTTNLSSALLGLEYGLSGRAARPSGKHIAAPCFIEWMMGVPKGWTCPQA